MFSQNENMGGKSRTIYNIHNSIPSCVTWNLISFKYKKKKWQSIIKILSILLRTYTIKLVVLNIIQNENFWNNFHKNEWTENHVRSEDWFACLYYFLECNTGNYCYLYSNVYYNHSGDLELNPLLFFYI